VANALVIEDSDSARERIRAVLAQAGLFERVFEARDGIAGLRAILSEPVDVVLCDLEMPGLDGEKLLHAHRERRGADDVPFLFLTAERDPDRLARLLRAGAADTVTKPFHPAELLARVETHLRLRRLRAELREKNAMLERLSTTDALTGLRNRRYLEEVLRLEVLRAARYRTPLAALMLDVDHFKRVNDTHGHPVGDEVLRRVAAVLAGVMRATDVAGRWGGEEFLAVFLHNDLDGAAIVAERLRADIESLTLEATDGRSFAVTASFGIAALAPGEAAESLLERTDAALYAAKSAGRNRVARAASPARGVDSDAGSSRPEAARGRSR
jgi:diguanylate cyclase (GGDEF)-like protein